VPGKCPDSSFIVPNDRESFKENLDDCRPFFQGFLRRFLQRFSPLFMPFTWISEKFENFILTASDFPVKIRDNKTDEEE